MASPIILASIERKINPRRLVNVCPSSDRNLIDSHVVRRIEEKKTNWFVWLRLIGKPQIKRRRRRRFFAGFCAFYWFASSLVLVWASNDSPSATSQIRRRRLKEPIKYQLGFRLSILKIRLVIYGGMSNESGQISCWPLRPSKEPLNSIIGRLASLKNVIDRREVEKLKNPLILDIDRHSPSHRHRWFDNRGKNLFLD